MSSPHASVWPSQTGLLSSGHPRPKTVSFSISRVSPRLASPGSDSSLFFFLCSSLVLYGILFSLRTGHLRSSDNACFSFPSPDHRPSLYQISVRSRSFGWLAEIVPSTQNSSLRLVRLRVKKRFVGARLDTGSTPTSPNHVSFSQHPTFVYAPPNWRP
jgi:hypothetical protein